MPDIETLPSKALRCVRYLQRFGIVDGSRNFVRTLFGARVVSLVDPLTECKVAVRTRTSDILTFGQVFVARDYDFDFGDLAPKLIIDAGANVGHSTVFLARRFPDAQIVALEPDSSNFEMLVRNTKPYPRVIALNKALWSRVCGLKISNPTDHNWAFQIMECDENEDGSIDATTISEVLELVGRDRVDLLKLDIEGSEKEVFTSGFENWLPSVRGIIIELHDWFRPGSAKAFYSALGPYNFNQYWKGENILVLKDVR